MRHLYTTTTNLYQIDQTNLLQLINKLNKNTRLGGIAKRNSSEITLENHLQIQISLQEMEINNRICVFPPSLFISEPKLLLLFFIIVVARVWTRRTHSFPWTQNMG